MFTSYDIINLSLEVSGLIKSLHNLNHDVAQEIGGTSAKYLPHGSHERNTLESFLKLDRLDPGAAANIAQEFLMPSGGAYSGNMEANTYGNNVRKVDDMMSPTEEKMILDTARGGSGAPSAQHHAPGHSHNSGNSVSAAQSGLDAGSHSRFRSDVEREIGSRVNPSEVQGAIRQGGHLSGQDTNAYKLLNKAGGNHPIPSGVDEAFGISDKVDNLKTNY